MSTPDHPLSRAFRFYQVALRRFVDAASVDHLNFLEAIRNCRDSWEGVAFWLTEVEVRKGIVTKPLLLGAPSSGKRNRKSKWLPDLRYWKEVHESSSVVPDLRKYVPWPEIEGVEDRCNRAHHGTKNLDLNTPTDAIATLGPTYRMLSVVADRIGMNGQVVCPKGVPKVQVVGLPNLVVPIDPEITKSFSTAVDAIGRLVDAALFRKQWEALKSQNRSEDPQS